MIPFRITVLALSLLFCPATNTLAEMESPFFEIFDTLQWVAYSPSTGDPSSQTWATEEDLQRDLKILAYYGFDGVVTYGCSGTGVAIPMIAREVGFKSVILGVWNPKDIAEVAAAKAIAFNVDAYCIGNENLDREYSIVELAEKMKDVRESTGKPVTTSEELGDYFKNPGLLKVGDWVFPNVHPYWAGIKDPKAAADWTEEQYLKLERVAEGKPILFKEVGLPTAGDPEINEDKQGRYYQELGQQRIDFVYFEAFDQPWKKHLAVEPFWGLFKEDRRPKEVIELLFPGREFPSDIVEDAEDKESLTLAFSVPQTGSTVDCRTDPLEGGKIVVKGVSKDLDPSNYTLLLFVNPEHPGALGWYLQHTKNGIKSRYPDGKWDGIVQLGNSEYPPQGGERISIAVAAMERDDAKELVDRTRRDNDRPFSAIPIEAIHSHVVENVQVRIVK